MAGGTMVLRGAATKELSKGIAVSLSGTRRLNLLNVEWWQNLREDGEGYADGWHINAQLPFVEVQLSDYRHRKGLIPKFYKGGLMWMGFDFSVEVHPFDYEYTGDADELSQFSSKDKYYLTYGFSSGPVTDYDFHHGGYAQ